MENTRVIECPNCGLKHQFKKLEKGYAIEIPCIVQFDRTIGCGYIITVKLSEKKYGENN